MSESSSTKLSRILREPVNSLTHMAGAVLSAVGLFVLIWLTRGQPIKMVSVIIYGVSLILLSPRRPRQHVLAQVAQNF